MIGITRLLQEDGARFLNESEQFYSFSGIKGLLPYTPRPLWLCLSVALREAGFVFPNGIGISGQMRNMRDSFNNQSFR